MTAAAARVATFLGARGLAAQFLFCKAHCLHLSKRFGDAVNPTGDLRFSGSERGLNIHRARISGHGECIFGDIAGIFFRRLITSIGFDEHGN
jgi:hypothetical protein